MFGLSTVNAKYTKYCDKFSFFLSLYFKHTKTNQKIEINILPGFDNSTSSNWVHSKMFTMRLICLILVLYATKESISMEVDHPKQVKFSILDVIQIRNVLNLDGKREADPFRSLLDGIDNSGRYVQLAKHHIIPEKDIRSELKKLANGLVDKVFKNKLESYVNNANNIESRDMLIDAVALANRNDPIQVCDSVLSIISWNPNNLRAGPLGNARIRDPDSSIDLEISSTAEQVIAKSEDSILNKLTSLRSSTNPTWWRIMPEPKPWKVSVVIGIPYRVTQLLKKDADDKRSFNIEEGVIQDVIVAVI